MKSQQKILNWVIHTLNGLNRINLRSGLKVPSKVLIRGANIAGRVVLNEGVKLQGGVTLVGDSEIEIGRFTSINGPNTDIVCKLGRVQIGAFCSIARNVTIQEVNHFSTRATTYHIFKNIFNESNKDVVSKGEITIGNDVWIGTHCVILSGAKIGDGAIVAANSVVTGDVPPYAIVGGSPAKIIRYRFPPAVIDWLLKVQWWTWEEKKILNNRRFFDAQLNEQFLDAYDVID